MGISTLDTWVVGIYAVAIFSLAQWVSRERGEHKKNAQDYFLASRALPWWAIGTTLIAANISAEQIIRMSGSGIELQTALIALAVFAGAYALYGGLKAVALTDIVQVSLLVLGGLIISYLALDKVSGNQGIVHGFLYLQAH